MVVSDDWLFRNAFIYQCNGNCEQCNEECDERIKQERKTNIKTFNEWTDGQRDS